MAYTSIPANPAYKARWDAWANTLADNVRELITDVPAMKTAATALTTRVSQAETRIDGVAASISGASTSGAGRGAWRSTGSSGSSAVCR